MTDALREKLAGRRVVASISGGKDSAAMSLWLTEQGIEHDRVFMDTGWEHPLTYEYLRGPLTKTLGPILEIGNPLGMAGLIRKKAMFPSRTRRFCTQELKIFPMIRHITALQDAGDECINCVGIRAGESAARSKMPEWECSESFDCDVWRPLIAWTEAEVIAIHGKHGLPPNPLYLLGASRVGCWPCIFARKAEVELVARVSPERIAAIDELERSTEAGAARRYAAKGETFSPLGYQRPSFFQSRTPEYRAESRPVYGGPPDKNGNPTESGIADVTVAHYPCWPIAKVVEWSRTSRGGKQFEMFAAAGREAGCVRWGLCDTGASDDEGTP